MLTVCHIVTRTTQRTAAPKNHCAFEPISPGLRKRNQAMARLPATAQASHVIARQPPIAPHRRGARRADSVDGVGSAPSLSLLGSERFSARADCATPVILPPISRATRCGFRLGLRGPTGAVGSAFRWPGPRGGNFTTLTVGR